MPTVQVPAQLTVEHVMAAVKHFSPDKLHEFKRQFAAWQRQNGEPAVEEAKLVQATKMRLSVAEARQLKRLIAKSERGTLTPKGLDAYRALAQQAEQLNVARMEALAELVQRRGQPTHIVMDDIGWEKPST